MLILYLAPANNKLWFDLILFWWLTYCMHSILINMWSLMKYACLFYYDSYVTCNVCLLLYRFVLHLISDNVILSGSSLIFSADASMASTNNWMFVFPSISDLIDSPPGMETSILTPMSDRLVIIDWKTDWIDFSFSWLSRSARKHPTASVICRMLHGAFLAWHVNILFTKVTD